MVALFSTTVVTQAKIKFFLPRVETVYQLI